MNAIDQLCPLCKAPANHPCAPFANPNSGAAPMNGFHRERVAEARLWAEIERQSKIPSPLTPPIMEREQFIANRILQEQGYIVMSARKELALGERRRLGKSGENLGEVVVVGKSSEEEAIRQDEKFDTGYDPFAPYFYRMAAE